MSKSAHEQSEYKLRKLPRCSRCNSEFVLVCASYEKIPELVYEWECIKCDKKVPFNFLQQEKQSPQDESLSRMVKKIQEQFKRKK